MPSYLSLPGSAGSFASTPDSATFPTGAGAIVDVIAEIEPSAWTFSGSAKLIAGHGQNASLQRSWQFRQFGTGGSELAAVTSANGTTVETDRSGATGFSGRKFVRCLIDTSAQEVRYYHKNNSGDPWTEFGGPDALTLNTLFDTAADMTVGGDPNGGQLFSGKVYRVSFYSGNSDLGGALVASPDFTAETPGITSFNDAQGNTWTLRGHASIVDTIEVTSPRPYQIFQRSLSSNRANISVTGAYSSGTPTSIEYSTNGTTWSVLDAAPAGGAFSGTLSNVPAGQFTLSVRFSNDTGVTASAPYVGVGDVFVMAGQSNMSGRGTNSQAYTPTAGDIRAGLFSNTFSWGELLDPYDSSAAQTDTVSSDSNAAGSIAPLIATLIMADREIPVAFIPCAMGGTSITAHLPGADHLDRATLYGSMNYRIGQAGGARAVLWWQGETDAVAGMDQATYNGHLDTMANAIQSDRGIKLMPCKLQHMTDPAATQSEQDAINAAIEEAWTDNSNVLEGPDLSDIDTDDTAHLQTDAKLADAAGRWWAKMDVALTEPSPSTRSHTYQKLQLLR